jgi:hypothetical protein
LTSADDVRGWTLGDSAAYLSPDDGIMLYYYGAGEEAAKAVSPKFATFNIDTIADTLTFAYMAGYQTYLQVFSDTFAAKFRRDTAACNAAGEACTQTLTQIRTAAQNYARTQAGMAAQAVTTIVKVSVWDAWSGQAAQELFTKTIDGEDNLEDDVVIVPLDAYKGKDIKVIVEITQGDFTFWNFAAAASTARARLFP